MSCVARDIWRDPADLPLELKGEEVPTFAAMGDLLDRMRRELDQQFQNFADIRDEAMRRQQQAGAEALPDAEAKLARADLKSAVDALSVIVRTLEKVDQLQRQLVADQAELDAAPENLAAHEALFDRVEAMIEARVAERVALQLAALVDGAANGAAGESKPGAAKPPDAGAPASSHSVFQPGRADAPAA